jgi:electron transfer flavoprotein beta subunit
VDAFAAREETHMTTVVAYSWARDAASALIRADGTVDWRSTRMSAGEDDHAAVAVARNLAEAGGGEVVGVTIGDGDASWALARGVSRAVCVVDAPALDDEAATAVLLAGAVQAVPDADVVVIGDSEEHPTVAAALAGLLGWPAVLGVTSAVVAPDGIVAVRRSGDADDIVTVAGPVVLGIRAESAEAHTPGMKEMLTARKRPIEQHTMTELELALLDPPTPLGTRLPDQAGAQMFTGSPDEAARSLVAALRADGALR